jgi:hypothetical protein
VFQERRSTGEVSCRTEAPSAARLPIGVEGEADEEDSSAPGEATCAPAAAGAAQDRHPTSDPACQEAAMERTIFPTKFTQAARVSLNILFFLPVSIFSFCFG